MASLSMSQVVRESLLSLGRNYGLSVHDRKWIVWLSLCDWSRCCLTVYTRSFAVDLQNWQLMRKIALSNQYISSAEERAVEDVQIAAREAAVFQAETQVEVIEQARKCQKPRRRAE